MPALLAPIVMPLSLFFIALMAVYFGNFYNLLIDLLNTLISVLGPAAVAVIGIFPANPCGSLIASCSDIAQEIPADPALLMKILHTIAWLMPMQFLANLVGCVLLSVMAFFTIAPVARYLKLLT